MKSRIIWFIAGFTLLLASCSSFVKSDSGEGGKISRLLDSLMADPEIEAISAGVIIDGKSYTFHRGKLLDGKTPDDRTIYEMASLTKTFAGTLLAQAIVEGKVQIDDPVTNYLNDSLPNLSFRGMPVTFRHLVTHQSGLPRMFPDQEGLFEEPDWDKLPYRLIELQENYSRADFFEELAKVELDTFPSIRLSYSNAGANLLGYALENIYEASFERILENGIFYPLDMDHSVISIAKADLDNLAEGQNANKVKMPFRTEKGMNAEGGILSCTEDMLKYLQFHLNEDDPVIAASHQHLWNGQYGDYEAGLFWQINKNGEGPETISQNGGAFGTSSWVTIIPEKDKGVFLVTNIAGPNIHQKLGELAARILE